MTEVHYFTACTLDGYIADEHNSLDWLFEVPDDESDTSWDDWFPAMGSLVMGATTYEWVLEHERLLEDPSKWHTYYGERPSWVFTHRELPRVAGIDVTFVEGDVRPVYDEIVERTGGANVWVVGGGDLVGQFFDAGLLHRIILGMVPVTLGAGAPLLPRRITSRHLVARSARLVGQHTRIVLDVVADAASPPS